jgi:hypothetical protein
MNGSLIRSSSLFLRPFSPTHTLSQKTQATSRRRTDARNGRGSNAAGMPSSRSGSPKAVASASAGVASNSKADGPSVPVPMKSRGRPQQSAREFAEFGLKGDPVGVQKVRTYG